MPSAKHWKPGSSRAIRVAALNTQNAVRRATPWRPLRRTRHGAQATDRRRSGLGSAEAEPTAPRTDSGASFPTPPASRGR